MRIYTFLLLCGFSLLMHKTMAQRHPLLPDFVVGQYAGSIGYASIGAGYHIKNKSRLSLHYGYVPKSMGGDLHILTTKFFYTPFAFQPKPTVTIKPFDFGAMVSYHFGSDFSTSWSSYRYPEGYYWWKTSLRLYTTMESSITYTLSSSTFKTVVGYVEFNTNDLYVVSYVLNTNSLRFFDIVKMGAGIRLTF